MVDDLHAALALTCRSSIVVRAPATSANLGPGFDCLGLALDLWNEVSAVAGVPPLDTEENLIHRAARAVFEPLGATYPGFRAAVHQSHPVRSRAGQQRRGDRLRPAHRQ